MTYVWLVGLAYLGSMYLTYHYLKRDNMFCFWMQFLVSISLLAEFVRIVY